MLFAALTHTLTHTGKRTGGTHGTMSFRPHPFCGKNAHKALQIKGWEDFYHLVRMRSAVRIRPAAPKSIENFGFRCFFVEKTHFYVRIKMCGNRLTHTRKCSERAKDERTDTPSAHLFLISSHHLCHEAAHGLCGFVLLLTGGVGVGAESEPRIVVPQHTADSFHVHAVL